MRRATALLLLLFLCACLPKKRELPPERCIPLERLPEELSAAFGGELKGRFSLKLSREGQIGVFRGEFLYRRGEGLWAVGRDLWGREIFEIWVRERICVLYPRQKVLFLGKLQGATICLSFGEFDPSGLPHRLRGTLGPVTYQLRLKNLAPSQGERSPPLDPSRFKEVYLVEDPLAFLQGWVDFGGKIK